jgi:hypothetical protein
MINEYLILLLGILDRYIYIGTIIGRYPSYIEEGKRYLTAANSPIELTFTNMENFGTFFDSYYVFLCTAKLCYLRNYDWNVST